jgi:hypothetical protein
MFVREVTHKFKIYFMPDDDVIVFTPWGEFKTFVQPNTQIDNEFVDEVVKALSTRRMTEYNVHDECARARSRCRSRQARAQQQAQLLAPVSPDVSSPGRTQEPAQS